MAFTGFSYFFSLLLSLTISHINISEGTNPICKATHNVSLCEIIVGGETNARDATFNAIHAAASTNRDIQKKLMPLIEKAAAEAKLPPAERSALVKLCAGDFERTAGDLNTSVIFICRGDPRAASSFLSDALNASIDCRDAVTQKVGGILALDDAVDLFDDVVDVTISLAHQIESSRDFHECRDDDFFLQ